MSKPLQEELLDRFFSASPVGMCLMDRDLRFLKINEALARIGGPPVEAHLGKTMQEVVPGLVPIVGPALRRVFETGNPLFNAEMSGEDPNQPGVIRHMLLSLFPIKYEEGRVSVVGGVLVEITPRKQMEESLRESEKELRKAQCLARIGSWKRDVKTGTGIWSDELYRIFDYDPAQPLPAYGERLAALTPESMTRLTAAVERAEQTGESFEIELEIQRKDGTQRFIVSRGEAVRDTAGKIVEVRGTAQDITERKRMENALRESEERFRQLAENIDEVFWLTELPSMKVRYVSPAFERIWGFPAQRLYEDSMLWTQAILPEERHRVEEAFEKAVGDSGFDVTYRILRPDHEMRWIHDRGFLVPTEKGESVRMAGLAQDITAQRELEQQLQTALQMRDEFLSVASHDLKTPITSLSLLMELVQRSIKKAGAALPESIVQLVAQARGQVERIGNLVDDLLDLTRIRVGKLELKPVETDLTEAVRATVSQFSEDMKSRGMTISVHTKGPVIGLWDVHRIDQVITNLVSNVLKYGGGNPADIFVEQDRERGLARLRIKDQGIGIEPGLQEKIFERFERAVENRAIKGLGLGLYITRQIVEAHGGSIRVESAPGKGSCFTVELPLRPRRFKES